MNNTHIIMNILVFVTHKLQPKGVFNVSTFTFITKEIVDKDFKFGYVCKFQYAIKSTA